MKKSRYFIVFYAAFHSEHEKYYYGNVTAITNGLFINDYVTRTKITASMSHLGFMANSVTITNVLELNKDDYNEYIK